MSPTTTRRRSWSWNSNSNLIRLVLILILVLAPGVITANAQTGVPNALDIQPKRGTGSGLRRYREDVGRSGWDKRGARGVSVSSTTQPTTLSSTVRPPPTSTSITSLEVNQYLAAGDITLPSPPDALTSSADGVESTIFTFGENSAASTTTRELDILLRPIAVQRHPTTSSSVAVEQSIPTSPETTTAQGQESTDSAPAPYNVVPTTTSATPSDQPEATGEGNPVENVPASSTSVDPAPQPSSEPAPAPPEPSNPAPEPEPAPENSPPPPPGPVETTLLPTASLVGNPSTVLLTSTGAGKAVTITRTANGGVLETVITGPGSGSGSGGVTKTGPGGVVIATSTSGGSSTTVLATTKSTVVPGSETETEAGGTKTYTVIINPSAAIRKVIPFIIQAKEGDVVEFLVYSGGDDNETSEAGSEKGVTGQIGVQQLNPGLLCEPVSLDVNATGSTLGAGHPYTVPAPSSSPTGRGILLGSTDPASCTAGMTLLINTPLASVTSNSSKAVQVGGSESVKQGVVFSDGVEVKGGTVGDVLTVWGGLNSANAQAIAAFSSSPDITPPAWAWGQDFSIAGLEGYKMDDIVQNILYTRLTLALNPSLLELYSPTTPDGTAVSKTEGGPTAVTQITAYDSFLTSLIGSSTAAYGGNAGEMSTGSPFQAGPGRHNGAGGESTADTLSLDFKRPRKLIWVPPM